MPAKKSHVAPVTPRLDREYGVCRGCGHGATDYLQFAFGLVTWFVCTPCRHAWPRRIRFTSVLTGCTVDAGDRRNSRLALQSLRQQRAELDSYIEALEATP
jgi:hypothetical protein